MAPSRLHEPACAVNLWTQALVREQLPRLRTEADRAALLANLICEAFGNYMGVVTEESALPPLAQLQVPKARPYSACSCVDDAT